jgi:hypothetical protein
MVYNTVKLNHPRNPNHTYYIFSNCQIRKFKIIKLKQQVMPTYFHIDSTDVIENDYNTQKVVGRKQNKTRLCRYLQHIF